MLETNQAGTTTRVGNWDRPAHHQCAHVMESGVRCQASTATGKKLCHAHQRYGDSDPLYPIQVPLLEDSSSIRFVISQTSRQLAMGAIPPANGRAVLYGCRMALDLLLYEQAREKRALRQEKMEKKLAAASASASQPVRESESTTVESETPVESSVCENRADMGQPGEQERTAVESETSVQSPACENRADIERAEGTEPEGEPEPEREPVPYLRRREPRFADLRGQWDQAMGRVCREISANLTATKDEDGKAWLERMNGPLQAGHPQMRQAHPYLQNAIAAGRSADASAYGDCPASELGPRELPFNPAFPPRSPEMDDWREEHIAAWYRSLVPTAGEKEAREYASSTYKAIQRNKAEAAAPAAATAAAPEEAVPAAS